MTIALCSLLADHGLIRWDGNNLVVKWASFMKIYPCKTSESSKLMAFEIDNIYVKKAAMAHLLFSVKDVTNIKTRKAFSKSDDVLIWFEYGGEKFIVWEPYGDNSRYWIWPEKPEEFDGDITPIADAFKSYKPTLLRRVIGDVVSFKFYLNNK